MTIETWQTQLRRQFGRDQPFQIKNLGDDPVFSDFLVSNPGRGTAYRVTIRGSQPGENACTCPDFGTNTLGTCKHLEFVLAKLRRTKSGESALATPFHPHLFIRSSANSFFATARVAPSAGSRERRVPPRS